MSGVDGSDPNRGASEPDLSWIITSIINISITIIIITTIYYYYYLLLLVLLYKNGLDNALCICIPLLTDRGTQPEAAVPNDPLRGSSVPRIQKRIL